MEFVLHCWVSILTLELSIIEQAQAKKLIEVFFFFFFGFPSKHGNIGVETSRKSWGEIQRNRHKKILMANEQTNYAVGQKVSRREDDVGIINDNDVY